MFSTVARTGRSLTFTFAPEATVRPSFPARVRALVEAAGGRVCFVRLIVSESAQELRIGNEDRKRFHKLTNLTTRR